MLRITTIHDSHGPALKLEGKLLAPWTEEVCTACVDLAAQTTQPRLDLKDLSFVDAAGIKLLKRLQGEGFDLAACSPFVAAVLQVEKL
jgi:ABC-type transporter Mla MlaB component